MKRVYIKKEISNHSKKNLGFKFLLPRNLDLLPRVYFSTQAFGNP